MNHIARRFLTPLLIVFLAGSLAGCYTLLKHSGVTDDSEETQVIIISEPWPIPPPPPPPPPPPVPPEPPPPHERHEPPPPPPPTRPIDPKQPEKPATKVKEKVPPGTKTLEMETTKTS